MPGELKFDTLHDLDVMLSGKADSIAADAANKIGDLHEKYARQRGVLALYETIRPLTYPDSENNTVALRETEKNAGITSVQAFIDAIGIRNEPIRIGVISEKMQARGFAASAAIRVRKKLLETGVIETASHGSYRLSVSGRAQYVARLNKQKAAPARSLAEQQVEAGKNLAPP